MADEPGSKVRSESGADGAAEGRGFRDLIGLMALPALWAGRDGASVLLLMTEAIEHIVSLDMSYADLPLLADQAPETTLRLHGRVATANQILAWQAAMNAWRKMAFGSAAERCETPFGTLRIMRLRMSYSSRGGSIWYGSADPAFPTVTQLAYLRAAASLTATGLQAARMTYELKEANRAKDQFLAMLGHELRNPLAPIVTSLALIKRQSVEPLSSGHAIIERQVNHLCRLVDDLMDVTRITRGKVELKKENIPLRSILVRAFEAVSPLLEQRRHELTVDLPDESIHVHGDMIRLTQVFSNLLTNAAKYTTLDGKIWVTTRLEAGDVEVSVRDNGAGITAKLLPNLFRIFEQGETTIERSSGGLGIGLSLVKSFVELHGGTVVAASDGPETGSEFTVRLPVATGFDAAVLPTIEPPQSLWPQRVPAGLRVMLVDDNTDILDSMRALLSVSGFEVATALDPVEALSVAIDFKPTIALLDIGLPGMDGYQLAVELRRCLPSQPLRLIALSGYGQSGDSQRLAAAGFERHLVKPVDIDELIACLAATDRATALAAATA